MSDHIQSSGRFGATIAGSAVQRNRVLRNTYALLALSMLPTVLGAWVGVATGITAGLTGFLGLVVFLGGGGARDRRRLLRRLLLLRPRPAA